MRGTSETFKNQSTRMNEITIALLTFQGKTKSSSCMAQTGPHDDLTNTMCYVATTKLSTKIESGKIAGWWLWVMG